MGAVLGFFYYLWFLLVFSEWLECTQSQNNKHVVVLRFSFVYAL